MPVRAWVVGMRVKCTGRVIKGMEVVRQIENVKTDKRDRPLTTIRIESVSVHAE